METSDFDYILPPERIAQTPIEPRHDSRLLIMRRESDVLEHAVFKNIGDYLLPGDLLVINQTRVIPARIFARKASGGLVELLLLNRRDALIWEALVGGKKIRQGSQLTVDDRLTATVVEVMDGPRRLVQFNQPVEAYLDKVGQMPLPPYIHETLQDPERYQTVYAVQTGSAAAPTAGLHFTPELMAALEEKGVRFARLTLHVGLDTFAPVTEANPMEHKIHTEWCEMPEEAARLVNETKKSGGRIIAVGTTSVRVLETATHYAKGAEAVGAFSGPTNLFILPGYEFKVVDALITNFHLPRSTLLMLVSAFTGRERILAVYAEAVRLRYRFYSFGDAMLIL